MSSIESSAFSGKTNIANALHLNEQFASEHDSTMTDAVLTEEQGVALLRKLSSDDLFREQFETKPAKALYDAGIPLLTIVNLSALCLRPTKLASKESFRSVLNKLEEKTFANALKMIIPTVKMFNG